MSFAVGSCVRAALLTSSPSARSPMVYSADPVSEERAWLVRHSTGLLSVASDPPTGPIHVLVPELGRVSGLEDRPSNFGSPQGVVAGFGGPTR
jgi:hypothetical protein